MMKTIEFNVYGGEKKKICFTNGRKTKKNFWLWAINTFHLTTVYKTERLCK